MEKPAAAHAEKGKAGAAHAAKPAAATSHAASGDAAAVHTPVIPLGDAKRVGSFAALAGWVFGVFGGIAVTALIGARPAWLFGVVGVPIVLATYLFGTFAGGRVARSFLRDYIKA